jgi:hypothetical protein
VYQSKTISDPKYYKRVQFALTDCSYVHFIEILRDLHSWKMSVKFFARHTTHNTQHTTHNTQHTTHDTQHTTHNTQHTTHNTQRVCTLDSDDLRKRRAPPPAGVGEPRDERRLLIFVFFFQCGSVVGVEQNISWSACVSKILTDILFYVRDTPQSTRTIREPNLIKWCQ